MSGRVQPAKSGGFELVGPEDAFVDENAFLESLRLRGLSVLTARAYAFDLIALRDWMNGSGRVIRALNQADLLGFMSWSRDAGAGPCTINRRLTTCRLLYRFCTAEELPFRPGAAGPAPHYKGRGRDRSLGLHVLKRQTRLSLRVKVPYQVIEPLAIVQVRRFLATLRRYRDVAIVHLMLLCGLRSREVLFLEMGDIAWEERRLRIRGKGGRERTMPLPEVLVGIVRDYLRVERPPVADEWRLFVGLQGAARGRPMTPSGLRSLFRHRRRQPELATANAHRFRHTFGSDMAREGVRLPILQRMMGHADPVTTLRYIQLSMADIAREYQRALDTIETRYDAS